MISNVCDTKYDYNECLLIKRLRQYSDLFNDYYCMHEIEIIRLSFNEKTKNLDIVCLAQISVNTDLEGKLVEPSSLWVSFYFVGEYLTHLHLHHMVLYN